MPSIFAKRHIPHMMQAVLNRPMAAPLPREWLDTVASASRVLFGLIFIAWSWVSTVLILGRLVKPALTNAAIEGIPDRFLLAGGASFTAWQTRSWIVLIVEAQTLIGLLGHIGIWAAAIVGGIIAAKFGEVLLFGKRRVR